jgi:peptidoglycan/xylan/chitin deacetylase (PgdA/CDA1 family)
MEKIAYLTIDDAPSEDFRNKVDYLASKRISAVFFCIGKLLDKRREDVIYAIKRGFIIGNHSYDHPKFSDLPLKECYEQIRKTDGLIDEIYKKAGVKRPAKFFRFPFGDKGGLRKDKIQAFLRKLGYTQPKFEGITYEYYRKEGLLDDVDWYWTYDCMEYAIDSLEKVYERMDENVPEGCRGLNYADSEEIILIHDMSKTIHMFKPIIDRLITKGIKFKLPPTY